MLHVLNENNVEVGLDYSLRGASPMLTWRLLFAISVLSALAFILLLQRQIAATAESRCAADYRVTKTLFITLIDYWTTQGEVRPRDAWRRATNQYNEWLDLSAIRL